MTTDPSSWRRPAPRRSPGSVVAALVASSRPGVTLPAGFAAAATASFAGGVSLAVAAACGVVTTLVAMLTMVVNDVHDVVKDRHASVMRPIAAGVLSRAEGGAYVVALALGALLAAPNAPATGGRQLLLVCGSIVVGVLYSPFARHLPLFKGLYTALACCLPLVYGGAVGGRTVLPVALLVVVLFNLGRELFLDAHHLAGDQRAGLHTLASLLGKGTARRIGLGIMFGAAIVLLIGAPSNAVARFSAVGGLVVLGLAVASRRVGDEGMRHATRAVLALGALGVASTAAP